MRLTSEDDGSFSIIFLLFLYGLRDGGFDANHAIDAVDTMIAALCLRATASILAKREVFLMLIADLMILCLTAGNAHGHHHPFGFPHHATESPVCAPSLTI